MQEFEDELESHAVHVGHGEDRDDAVATIDGLAEDVLRKVVVRPEGTIGNHDALGETGGTAGVVNHSQLFAIGLLVVVDMLLAEVFRELLAIELVEVLAGIGQLVGA